MAGEVAFFELGVEDVERGRAFYEGLFGWRRRTCSSGSTTWRRRWSGCGSWGTVDGMDVEGDEASVARWGRFKLCRDDQGSPVGLHQLPVSAA
jgi:predicted enzyme related to lactoylglutathione lyase